MTDIIKILENFVLKIDMNSIVALILSGIGWMIASNMSNFQDIKNK